MGRLIDSDNVKKLLIAKYEGAEYIIDDIRKIPTAGTEDKWIVVDERLPDGGVDVLVCTGNGWILIAWYGTNRQSWHITPTGITHDDIIAWMPLPEPYRNEENTP